MRILLIDDHTLFSESLRFLLTEMDDTCVCSAVNGVDAALTLTDPFDLILLDLNLPGSTGFSGLKKLRSEWPSVPVVIVTGEEKPALVHAAIAEGAMGFVCKSSSPQVLMAAMKLIWAGGTYLPLHVLRNEPQGVDNGVETKNINGSGLSERQLEVLLKVVQGKPNKVIARELYIAESTVKSHLSTAFRILDVNNRTEAVFKVAQLGLKTRQD